MSEACGSDRPAPFRVESLTFLSRRSR